MAKISRIMVTGVPTLKKDANVSDAAKLMASKPHGCVVVVENKKPVGIITESDIVKNLISKKINPKEKVSKIMSSPITSLSHDTTIEKADKIIDTKHFKRYPVMEDGNLVGLVTEHSVVQAINGNIRLHRNIQNAVLIVFLLLELFVFILNENLVKFLRF